MGARKHQLVNVNGVRIHTVEEGEGPLVILVHGFPELWYSWRFQLPAIANAGYRVVAIDQRGYGRSSKFWDPDAYRIHRMVDDLVGLVGALGYKEAILIGHDWGAPIAWNTARLHAWASACPLPAVQLSACREVPSAKSRPRKSIR